MERSKRSARRGAGQGPIKLLVRVTLWIELVPRQSLELEPARNDVSLVQVILRIVVHWLLSIRDSNQHDSQSQFPVRFSVFSFLIVIVCLPLTAIVSEGLFFAFPSIRLLLLF